MNFQQNFIPQYNNATFIPQQGYNQSGDILMNGGNIMGGNNMMSQQVLTNITNIQQPIMQQQQMEFTKMQQQQNFVVQQQQQVQADPMSQQPYPSEPTNSEKMYTKYEDLPSLGSNLDIVSVVNTLKMYFENKSNWKSPFDALDNLRILNKYYPSELNNIVIMFWKYIVECIESPKTFICKNALFFITEIFMNSKNVRIHDDIISGLVPHVLSKASSDKSFMKKEAQNALKELTVNCCYDITVMVLCQQTLDKNPAIGDIAILTLAQMLNNIGGNINKLNSTTLVGLTRCLAKTLDTGKHAEMKKYATMICQYIHKLFGLDDYATLIKGSNLTKGEEIEMVKIVETQKNTKRVNNLQEFKTEKKKQARKSMMSQNVNVPFSGFGYQGMNENVNPQQMLYMQGGFQQQSLDMQVMNQMNGMMGNSNPIYNFQSGNNMQNFGNGNGMMFQNNF